MYVSNSYLGYKFAFNMDVFPMKHAISKISVYEFTHDQLALIKNLKKVIDFRSGYNNIDINIRRK